MKNTKKYFEKNYVIYGIAYKFAFGKWIGYKTVFHNYKEALNWLNTESFDFMTRELVCKTKYLNCNYNVKVF